MNIVKVLVWPPCMHIGFSICIRVCLQHRYIHITPNPTQTIRKKQFSFAETLHKARVMFGSQKHRVGAMTEGGCYFIRQWMSRE